MKARLINAAVIMAMAEPAWAASLVPPPSGVPERLGAIRAALEAFLEAWRALPVRATREQAAVAV